MPFDPTRAQPVTPFEKEEEAATGFDPTRAVPPPVVSFDPTRAQPVEQPYTGVIDKAWQRIAKFSSVVDRTLDDVTKPDATTEAPFMTPGVFETPTGRPTAREVGVENVQKIGEERAETFSPLRSIVSAPPRAFAQTAQAVGGMSRSIGEGLDDLSEVDAKALDAVQSLEKVYSDPNSNPISRQFSLLKFYKTLGEWGGRMALNADMFGDEDSSVVDMLESSNIPQGMKSYGKFLARGAQEEEGRMTRHFNTWDMIVSDAATSTVQFAASSLAGLGLKAFTGGIKAKNVAKKTADGTKEYFRREGAKLHHTVPWIFGAQEYGRAFHDALEKTGNLSQAYRHAEYSMILEGVTEYLPAKKLFAPGSKGYKRLLDVLTREIPGENVAELGQRLSEYVNGLEGDLTGKEIVRRFVDEAPGIMGHTTAATVLGTGANVGIVNSTMKLYDSVSKFDREFRARRDMKKLFDEMGKDQANLVKEIAKASKTKEQFFANLQAFSDQAEAEGLTDPAYKRIAELGKVHMGYMGEHPEIATALETGTSRLYGTDIRFDRSEVVEGQPQFFATPLEESLRVRQEGLAKARERLQNGLEQGISGEALEIIRENLRGNERLVAETQFEIEAQRIIAEEVLPVLQSWTQEFSPDMKLVVTDGAHDTSIFNDPLGRMLMLEDGTMEIATYPKKFSSRISTSSTEDVMADPYNQKRMRELQETMIHEFGHALMLHELNKAPVEIRDAVYKGFYEQLKSLETTEKSSDFLNRRRGPFAARRDKLEKAGIDKAKDLQFYYEAVGGAGFDSFFDYLLSFQEYLAHQMERYAFGSQEGLKAIRPFMRKMHVLLQRFHSRVGKRFEPERSYQDYLGYLRASAQLQRLSQQLEAMQITREEIGQGKTLEDQIESAIQGVVNMNASGGNFNLEIGDPATPERKTAGDVDKYGKWIHKYGLALTQLAWDNPHINGLQKYLKLTQGFWAEKTKWNLLADETVKKWTNLGTKQSDNLAKFLLDVTVKSDELQRRLTPEELAEVEREGGYTLTDAAKTLFMEVDQNMQEALGFNEENPTGLYKILLRDARRAFYADPVQLQRQIAKIKDDMGKLANRNYFPLSRFGKHTVTVRALERQVIDGRTYEINEVISFETYESEREMKQVAEKRRREFPSKRARVDMDMLTDEEIALHQLPSTAIDAMIRELGLDDDQAQKLRELGLKMSPGERFKKHLLERKGTKGYSMDAMRGFAGYFMHFGNSIARMEYGPIMDESIREVSESVQGLKNSEDIAQQEMVTKRRQIQQHLIDHKEYLFNPGNEWASLRAAGFLWYLGGIPKSAWVNLTQIPMVAYPYLAARKELGGGLAKGGDAKAVYQLGRAMKDLSKVFATGKGLTQGEMDMMVELVSRGVVDESLATELAGVAEGSTLSRLLPGGHRRSRATVKGLRAINTVGTFLFHSAEKANRRITGLAAYRMARNVGMNHEEAVNEAHRAIDKSQYEYNRWNRPRFMRGKQSVIFLFMQYVQQTLHFLWRDPGNARALIMLYMIGGAMGLPGADDLSAALKDLINWYKKKWGRSGEYFDPQNEIRELAVALNANPDIATHGLGHEYGLGPLHMLSEFGMQIPHFDISASVSMGRIVPGMRESLEGSENVGGLTAGIAEALGPVAAAPLQMWDAIMSNDMDEWKRWERPAPALFRNMSKGIRWAARGEETDRSGATIARFDLKNPEHLMEIVGQMAGFTPTRVAQKKEFNYAQRQMEQFYNTRRALLMEEFSKSLMLEDDEGKREIMKDVNRFNATLPKDFTPLVVGPGLIDSFSTRFKKKLLRDIGINPQKRYIPAQEQLESLYGGGLAVEEEPTR